MKSGQLKFANPDYQNIDFEITNEGKNRLTGLLLLFVNILLFIAAITFSIYALFKAPSCLVIIIIWSIVSASTIKITRLSKRLLYDPSVQLETDNRSPVLYLRSFSWDIEEDAERDDKRTPEEILVSVFDQIGPIITVGDPRERHKNVMPYLGATRIFLKTDWQTNVIKLINISKVVIINADVTSSVLWELEIARKLVPAHQLFISFLSNYNLENHQEIYTRFAPEFKRIFEMDIPAYDGKLCFIDFDSYKKPNAISLIGDPFYRGAPNPFRRSPSRPEIWLEKAQEELNHIFWLKGLVRPADKVPAGKSPSS